jgi:hypothetical protein
MTDAGSCYSVHWVYCSNRIAEAEAAVSVNENKWLVMHMHVQLKLDELRPPPPNVCLMSDFNTCPTPMCSWAFLVSTHPPSLAANNVTAQLDMRLDCYNTAATTEPKGLS